MENPETDGQSLVPVVSDDDDSDQTATGTDEGEEA
jgi:hypothetical protein